MATGRRNLVCGLAVAVAAMVCAPVAFAGGPIEYKRINVGTLSVDDSHDEFVVKYRDGSVQRKNKAEAARSVNLAASAAFPAKTTLLRNGQPATPALRATHKRRLAVGADVFRTSRKLDTAEATELMQQIAADPAVEYVERSLRMVKLATPNDTHFAPYQWPLKVPAESAGGINAPPAWDQATGSGVVVAVIDTGVTEHPDLSANVLFGEGYDFYDRLPGGYDLGDWTVDGQCGSGWTGSASSWHGTHVAGTVAALTNNNKGVASVAPEAAVLPVRVLGPCGGWSTDIADALMWVAGGTVDGVPALGVPVDVINMSLGSGGPATCPNIYKDALAAVHAAGITVVVAAGNSDANVTTAGGVGYTMGNCSSDLIVVGGNGPTGRRGGVSSTGQTDPGWGSNWGPRVDIAAPMGSGWTSGEEQVLSTVNFGETEPTDEVGYAFYYGTSMSSPHVAGVAALILSAVDAKLSPAEVKTILTSSARPFPIAPDKAIGVGIVDANAAVTKALEPPCDPEVDQCAPVAIPLTNKVDVKGLSGASGSEVLYSFEASAGQILNILTLGGSGNVSLYVSFEQEPTAANAQFKSVRPGNNETVRVTAPQAGTYYIKLVGTAAYNGVTLVARQ